MNNETNKKIYNDLNGYFVLDKPKDFTSNDALCTIKRYLHPKKIGHTGTLDPNATGVLVCLMGNATKCQDYLMNYGEKEYIVDLIIGFSTDTEDFTGNIIDYVDFNDTNYNNSDDIFNEKIKNTINSFIGPTKQIPPMYSAKKINGKKLVDIARKGKIVDRKPIDIFIKNIEILKIENKNFIFDSDNHNKIIYDENISRNSNNINNKSIKCKYIKIRVLSSKGTYMRTLCKNIGDKISMPACMGDLRRVKSGYFNIDESITLDNIEKMANENDFSFIKPCFFQSESSVLTFGKFETLHIGHKKIIDRIIECAKNENIKSTLLLIGNFNDNRILTREQKISKLKLWGVDNIFDFPFNDYTKKMQYDEFFVEIVIKQLKAKKIIVGSDCSFGYKGIGNKDVLINLCETYNVDYEIIDKLKINNLIINNVKYNNIEVSSTNVKKELNLGNIELANFMLGKQNYKHME